MIYECLWETAWNPIKWTLPNNWFFKGTYIFFISFVGWRRRCPISRYCWCPSGSWGRDTSCYRGHWKSSTSHSSPSRGEYTSSKWWGRRNGTSTAPRRNRYVQMRNQWWETETNTEFSSYLHMMGRKPNLFVYTSVCVHVYVIVSFIYKVFWPLPQNKFCKRWLWLTHNENHVKYFNIRWKKKNQTQTNPLSFFPDLPRRPKSELQLSYKYSLLSVFPAFQKFTLCQLCLLAPVFTNWKKSDIYFYEKKMKSKSNIQHLFCSKPL